MQEPAPTLEDAYRQYGGLLFSALGKLAAQGFAVPPDDAADLVHDFFAEAWGGIAERYEPERATPGTYVYAAFVRFARPRIVRLQRFRGSLVEPREVERLAEAESDAPEPGDVLDLQRLHQAIIALPSPNRELLEYWLNAPSGSEREVARSLGLSRYQARLRLIDALGHVSVAVGALDSVESIDRDVALAVWRDGLTIVEASARLRLTAQQVGNAYRRNQRRLERTLSLMRGTQARSKRSETMSQIKTEELITRIYQEPYSKDLVRDITSHAAELVEYLGKTEDAPPASWEELPVEWLADVYSAIAVGLGTEFEPATDEALFRADAKDRESVGRAFFEVLVPAIPRGISSLIELSQGNLGRVSQQVQARLAHEADVEAGGQPAIELTAFGLTPTHLVLATDAVALLLERAIDAGYFPVGRRLFVRLFASGSDTVTCEGQEEGLTQSDLVDEIAAFAEVDNQKSAVLLHWAIDTAKFVPYLFVGFHATMVKDALALTQLTPSDTPTNLFQRWNSRPLSTTHMRNIVMTRVGTGKYTYELIQDYPKLPPGESFGIVSTVATDSQDRIYVLQRKDPPVVVFDRDGNYLKTWGLGAITDPHGMTITDDIVYITDRSDSVAMTFTLDGKPLQMLGKRGVHSDTGCERPGDLVPRAAGPFNYPSELAPGPSGDLYVSDGYRNARVHRFTRDGRLIASWGQPGKTEPGHFHLPHSVLVAPDGKVYVCDRANRRVQIFSADGTFISMWTGMGGPNDISRDKDGVFYICEQEADGEPPHVSIRDGNGTVLARWVCRHAHGLWVDSHGDIYLGLTTNHSVDKYVRVG